MGVNYGVCTHMALFGKKSETTTIPELQDYYATKKKDNTGLAWLLAVGSLFVTAAVLVGLFMGGRWAYRALTNSDKNVTVTADKKDEETVVPATPTTPSVPATGTTSPATGTPAPAIDPQVPKAPTAAPTQGVSPAQSPEQNRSAVAANTTLPDTGAGSVIVLFVSVMLVSSLAYRAALLKK